MTPQRHTLLFSCVFFNDTATTEIYTLSLHDALPISNFSGSAAAARVARDSATSGARSKAVRRWIMVQIIAARSSTDRKSTRLNSSHANISYAVFCLKKKERKKWNQALGPRLLMVTVT